MVLEASTRNMQRRWPRLNSDDQRPLRILVADDERPIARLMQVNLEHQGYEVLIASDGKQALAMLRKDQPDICILDIVMPLMDGFEVLTALRRDPTINDIYVIMLTTAVTDEDRAKGFQLGADTYFTKPFDPGEMNRLLM